MLKKFKGRLEMSLPLWYNTIMFNIKNYTKDYKTNSEVYQLKLPLELDGFVENNDSVRLLSIILEELDYTTLYKAYTTFNILDYF